MSPQTPQLSSQDVGMQLKCHPKLASSGTNHFKRSPPGDSLPNRALFPFQPVEACTNIMQ